MSYEAFMKADKKAKDILLAKGTIDPRLDEDFIKYADYDAIRKYDSLLATEIIKIMQKPSATSSEIPSNIKPKRDWAASAYDR